MGCYAPSCTQEKAHIVTWTCLFFQLQWNIRKHVIYSRVRVQWLKMTSHWAATDGDSKWQENEELFRCIESSECWWPENCVAAFWFNYQNLKLCTFFCCPYHTYLCTHLGDYIFDLINWSPLFNWRTSDLDQTFQEILLIITMFFKLSLIKTSSHPRVKIQLQLFDTTVMTLPLISTIKYNY